MQQQLQVRPESAKVVEDDRATARVEHAGGRVRPRVVRDQARHGEASDRAGDRAEVRDEVAEAREDVRDELVEAPEGDRDVHAEAPVEARDVHVDDPVDKEAAEEPPVMVELIAVPKFRCNSRSNLSSQVPV